MTSKPPLPVWFLYGLTAWLVLQLGRLIALPLIQAVLAQQESPVWLFPALVDIVVVVATPFVIFMLWRHRSPLTWLVCWTYFVVSIFDHASAVTATVLAGPPQVFVALFHMPPNAEVQGILQGPGGQTLIDLVFLALLLRRDVLCAFGVRN